MAGAEDQSYEKVILRGCEIPNRFYKFRRRNISQMRSVFVLIEVVVLQLLYF